MRPTHLPASALPQLLKDFAALINKDCDPGTGPLAWLAGCNPEEDQGCLPWACGPDEQELAPARRLDDGEELAVRLHTHVVGDPMTLIDGKEYLPAGGPRDEDDSGEPDIDSEWYDFPSETSFFALGVKREGNHLRIRPVAIHQCSSPGGVFHRSRLTEFPPAFSARIDRYLGSLA